jgi:hypothetical protein
MCKDDYYNNCKNIFDKFLILFHHMFNIFLQFGWLSNNKTILKLYIIVTLGTFTHWYHNDGNCNLTEISNTRCKLNKDNYFRDIWYFVGIKQNKNKHKYSFGVIYLIFAIIIALYKLYKKS